MVFYFFLQNSANPENFQRSHLKSVGQKVSQIKYLPKISSKLEDILFLQCCFDKTHLKKLSG